MYIDEEWIDSEWHKLASVQLHSFNWGSSEMYQFILLFPCYAFMNWCTEKNGLVCCIPSKTENCQFIVLKSSYGWRNRVSFFLILESGYLLSHPKFMDWVWFSSVVWRDATCNRIYMENQQQHDLCLVITSLINLLKQCNCIMKVTFRGTFPFTVFLPSSSNSLV